ncbi:MAG: adenylosuccinate lyase [Flavobacteriaceae bacterium]
MKLAELHFDIEKVNHSIESRTEIVSLVVKNPEILPEIVQYAFKLNKHHYRYCWLLEFLNRQDIEILCPFINEILSGAALLANDSAIRPIAKIIETFVLGSYGKQHNKSVASMMTSAVKEAMVTLCFQWLIDENLNVAAKAYSMTSLYHLGKDVKWVHEELRLVVEQNYDAGSAAYKARARMILKLLK